MGKLLVERYAQGEEEEEQLREQGELSGQKLNIKLSLRSLTQRLATVQSLPQ